MATGVSHALVERADDGTCLVCAQTVGGLPPRTWPEAVFSHRCGHAPASARVGVAALVDNPNCTIELEPLTTEGL